MPPAARIRAKAAEHSQRKFYKVHRAAVTFLGWGAGSCSKIGYIMRGRGEKHGRRERYVIGLDPERILENWCRLTLAGPGGRQVGSPVEVEAKTLYN
jgi:hypothetical protein